MPTSVLNETFLTPKIEELVKGGMALPDAIERVAFPDFVPPAPGAPDFHEGEFMEAAE